MYVYSTYSVKIKHYNNIFKSTVEIYRRAVDFFLKVCLDNWDNISALKGHNRLSYIKQLTHKTKI